MIQCPMVPPKAQGMVPYSKKWLVGVILRQIRKARASTYRCVTATGLISGHAMGRVMIFLGEWRDCVLGSTFFQDGKKSNS